MYIHILVPHAKKQKSITLDFLRLEKMTENFPLCDDAGIFDLYH